MRSNSICILLVFTLTSACTRSTSTAESSKGNQLPSPAATISQNKLSNVEQELERRLKTICDGAQGTVGFSLVHIESGNAISINGKSQLPLLYSVFKLPLAIAVLVSGSTLPDAAQQKLIAQLARAAYDTYSADPAKR